MSDPKLIDKAGGRKVLAFYSALACCFILALLDKAHTEVLGLIDTLFFIYVFYCINTRNFHFYNLMALVKKLLFSRKNLK